MSCEVQSSKVADRGTAAIELMFAAPVLMLCVFAMLDFGRALRSAQEGERAARHEAWRHGRSQSGQKAPAKVIQATAGRTAREPTGFSIGVAGV